MSERPTQYTVLARRFRPQTFDQVVGQGHVGQALRNAIRQGRVAHAYLFTGARGVGKTSTARIFAKALNCPNAVDGVPCNNCEVCQSIAAGSDVDVLEIDGASNRGIDDIRQLRANVNVRSMRSPFKVYIIDEVHMLTKEAFNALLKTLEEPPPNVKFIFCTTEPNKLPDTILSRCQRFDFGVIATTSIMDRLREIAEAEGMAVDEEAIELVARRAAGSMRDSQSLFDQLLAFGSDRVGAEDVHRLLGTAPDERVIELMNAVREGNRESALSQLHRAAEQGVELGVFSDQLLNYLRDLMIVAVGAADVPLLSVAARHREVLAEQARQWGLTAITASMQILAESKNRMQRVNYARSLLELALVRMTMLGDLQQLAALAAGGGGGAGGGSPAGASPSGLARPGAVTRPTPTPSSPYSPPGASAAADPGSKKKYDVNVGGGGEALGQAARGPVVAEAGQETPEDGPAKTIALSAATLDEFRAALVPKLPEMLANHLKNATLHANSGPNALEVRFPKSYGFSKLYCEKSDNQKRLQQSLAEVAGNQIVVRFTEDASATAGPAPVGRAPVLERRRPTSVDSDPFVQKAVAILNATVFEVREVAETAFGADSAEDNQDS